MIELTAMGEPDNFDTAPVAAEEEPRNYKTIAIILGVLLGLAVLFVIILMVLMMNQGTDCTSCKGANTECKADTCTGTYDCTKCKGANTECGTSTCTGTCTNDCTKCNGGGGVTCDNTNKCTCPATSNCSSCAGTGTTCSVTRCDATDSSNCSQCMTSANVAAYLESGNPVTLNLPTSAPAKIQVVNLPGPVIRTDFTTGGLPYTVLTSSNYQGTIIPVTLLTPDPEFPTDIYASYHVSVYGGGNVNQFRGENLVASLGPFFPSPTLGQLYFPAPTLGQPYFPLDDYNLNPNGRCSLY